MMLFYTLASALSCFLAQRLFICLLLSACFCFKKDKRIKTNKKKMQMLSDLSCLSVLEYTGATFK